MNEKATVNKIIDINKDILAKAIHDYWSDVTKAAREYIDPNNKKTAKQLSILYNVEYRDLLQAAQKERRSKLK